MRGFFLAAGVGLQHGVDHLADDALLGLGQRGDLFELLDRPTLAGGLGLGRTDERACE